MLELEEGALLEPRGWGVGGGGGGGSGRCGHVMESGTRQETQPPPKKAPTAEMGEKTPPSRPLYEEQGLLESAPL